ncbi:MAG: DUF2804 family protein [Labilithrix sp.]|nr:DUF2804 family protein [Labilithrix sp.]MCW5816678.1 DUF2804 family protein [Labilithrix sp.]
MRTLGPAQKDIAFGSFVGPLPRIDWGAAATTRALRGKRWIWLGLACKEAWLSLAIVRTGYAANVLAFVYDHGARAMVVDKTIVAPAFTAHVTDDAHAPGLLARFDFAGSHVAFERSGPDLEVRARLGGIDLEVLCDESVAPLGVAAIADLGGGLRNATEKRALMSVRGRFAASGRSYALEGATAGWDYTNGLLPRHTKWRWAFGLGRDLAFNLVEGFVGEAECALFADGAVHPLAEPRFTFDRTRPSDPWRIEADGIDLRFEVGEVHAQYTNLLLVRSHFLQPVGHFHGTIAGRTVADLPGVVEDQDVLW